MSGLVLAGFSALNEEDSGSNASDDSSVQCLNDSAAAEVSANNPAEYDLSELQDLDPRAEEDATRSVYNEALVHYGRDDFEAAERLFKEVLDSKYLAYCRHYAAATASGTQRAEVEAKLRYNALKYLAFCRGEHHSDYACAVDYLGRAAQIDKTDVQMLFKYGIYALKDDRDGGPKFHLARAAFEHVLRVAEDHKPSLDCLVSITFKLGDQYACLDYLDHLLSLDPGHKKALKLKARVDAGECMLQPDVLMGRKEEPLHDDDRIVPIPVSEMTVAGLLRSVTKTYRATPYEDLLNPTRLEEEEEEEKMAESVSNSAIEVSVQNVVNEIVDLVSERHEIARKIASSIINDIIDENIRSTDEEFIASVLDGIIGDVMAIAVAPTIENAAQDGTKASDSATTGNGAIKAANSNKARSFLDAVPEELIEKRRSTRVRGALEVYDDADSQLEAVTAKSLLESFIPRALAECDTPAESQDAAAAAVDTGAPCKVKPAKLKEFYSAEEQADKVRGFLEHLVTEGKFQNMLDAMRKSLHFAVRVGPGVEWPAELAAAYIELYLLWRDHFVLPNDPLLQHDEEFDIVTRACMMIVERVSPREEPSERSQAEAEREKFLKEDLFHINYYQGPASAQRVHDIEAIHFNYYVGLGDTERAIWQGNQVLHTYPADNPEDVVTKTSKEYVRETVKSLEYSKNLPRVQAFFEGGDFSGVVEILSRTIDRQNPNDDTWFSQMYMFVDSLWKLRRYDECFRRSATLARRLYSICSESSAMDAEDDDFKDLNNVLVTLECCIAAMGDDDLRSLDSAAMSIVCHTLVGLMCRQTAHSAPPDVLPWVLFFKILAAHDDVAPASMTYLPKAVEFLISGHECLGQLSTCTSSNGKFLLLLLEVLVPLFKPDLSPRLVDQLKKAIDQALFCLYCHPSKKSKFKYLVDHCITNLALRWDGCETFFSYVYPKKLPEYDDYKQLSISVDTEALLRRFYALVPEEYSLEERKTFVKRKLAKGKCRFEPYGTEGSSKKSPPEILRDLFYLLADYSFKSSEFKNAVDFYLVDLSFNPERLDSWIAISLSMANMVEEKISENFSTDKADLVERAKEIVHSFTRAIDLSQGKSQVR